MAHLYVAFTPASTGSNAASRLYTRDNGSTATDLVTLPDGIRAVDSLPQLLKYRRRVYIIGSHTRPMMRDEFGNARTMGVLPPSTVPTLVDAGMGASSKGQMIGYQTFAVKQGGKVIQRSNPGAPSDTLDSAGTGRLWGNLDVSPADPHVNLMEGWVSVDGSIPAKAWEKPLPTSATTIAENKPTAGLGETLPVKVGLDGAVDLAPNARGVPPYCRYAEEYHDAFFYAGDPLHPERIYKSKLFEPESVDSTPVTVNGRTEEPWLTTTDGAPVTGLKRQGDMLVVGTLRGIDVIQFHSDGDYSIVRISNYWGVLSHWSMRRCGPLSSLWFAAPQGPTIFNSGQFKYAGGRIETWWRDNYKLNPELFQNCYGAEDRFRRCYKLLIPRSGGAGTLYVNIDYFSGELSDVPVTWFDRRNRVDKVIGELLIDDSTNYFSLHTGSCDGMIREENDEEDADDDGDTYLKRLTIMTPHRFVMGQSGTEAHGRAFNGLDVYLKHETNSATLSLYAGDDDAPSAVAPAWTETSPATQVATGQRPKVQQTSEHHTPTGVSGKGATLLVEVDSPVGVEFRGWALEHIPGSVQDRPFSE